MGLSSLLDDHLKVRSGEVRLPQEVRQVVFGSHHLTDIALNDISVADNTDPALLQEGFQHSISLNYALGDSPFKPEVIEKPAPELVEFLLEHPGKVLPRIQRVEKIKRRIVWAGTVSLLFGTIGIISAVRGSGGSSGDVTPSSVPAEVVE